MKPILDKLDEIEVQAKNKVDSYAYFLEANPHKNDPILNKHLLEPYDDILTLVKALKSAHIDLLSIQNISQDQKICNFIQRTLDQISDVLEGKDEK